MAAVEEVVVATELQEEVAGAQVEENQAVEENPTVVKAKKSKEPKAKKVSGPKKPRSTSAHPTYFEMINEAITTLKERNGSSQYAIQKFIEENQKHLPPNFRKLLLFNLKKLVASARLVKVKNSFKLPATRSSAPKADSKPKPKAKSAAQPKPKPKPKAKTAAKSKAVAKPAPAKRKAATEVKPKAKPAKVAKTTAKSTPSKKVVAAKKKPIAKKATPAKKAPVKSVKARSVKSPAKRAMPKRGRK